MSSETPKFFQSLRPFPTVATQGQRRAQLVEMASVLARQCFDRSGVWLLPGHSPDARERIWICFALMLGSADDIALANAILAQTRHLQNTDAPASPDLVHPFDIFVSNHCIQMLVLHADKLQPAVLKKIESWAKMALNDYPGNRQADLQFHGYNDNMPSKAAMGMILGGEYFGDPGAVEHGLWSLRQLRDMLTRRGMVSEFNSPTYSPLTAGNLAEISRYSRNEEARLLSARLAERVWADILGHFHPPTGLCAGPYTRAYTTDSVGHLSSINFMMWLTFGEGVWPHPLEELRQEPPHLVLHHAGDLYFVLAQCCWLAAFEFEPPAHLVDWMKSRTYPFCLIATAERGEGGEDSWNASEILATNWQEEDFALATSEGDWGFQAEELFVQYRLHRPVRGIEDVRTGFPRFLVNDDVPGMPDRNHNGLFSGEKDFLTDHGRYHTIQHERVAMVLVGPNLRLAEKSITRMGCSFILPEHLTDVQHIEMSDGHVWIEDGPVSWAIRPLGATDWGRPAAVQIEKINRYRMIWMPNYIGPSRTFTRKELIGTVNGFIIIAGTDQDGSFESFRERILTAKLLDYHCAGSRTVHYQLDGLDMGINYGCTSGQARFITLNGKPIPRPIWQATGLPAERLPFLSEKPAPRILDFPFAHLGVAAASREPWKIFSRNEK